MSTKTIRLNTSLTFDEEKEKDIVGLIEKMNSSHRTGQFISNMFRVAMDCPEIIEKSGDKESFGKVMNQMDCCGASAIRSKFISEMIKQIEDMKKKVDEIYDRSVQLYILSKVGKQIGLEDKNNNILAAQFLLEKQMKELQDTLGVSLKDNVYASNKLHDTQKIADNAFEYILESYYSIIDEMKKNVVVATNVVPVQVQNTSTNNVSTDNSSNSNLTTEAGSSEDKAKETVQEQSEDDEIVEFGTFGEDGLNELTNFFGS